MAMAFEDARPINTGAGTGEKLTLVQRVLNVKAVSAGSGRC